MTVESKRDLKRQLRQWQLKRHSKINIWEMMTFLWLLLPCIFYCWQSMLQKRHYSTWREWKIYCCVFTSSLKPYIWKFHFVIWQTTPKNCTKVRACTCSTIIFSLFNQSDHCSLASSLPLLSSLLKLPNKGIVIASLSDWLKTLAPVFQAKPKPIALCRRDTSHALSKLQVIARNCLCSRRGRSE